MKKILTTLVASCLTVAAFAQGTVNWTGVAGFFNGQTNGTAFSPFVSSAGATLSGTLGNTLGNNTANNALLGYTGYYYALLTSASAVAPTTIAGLQALGITGLTATNGAASNGRIIQVAGTTARSASGWALGGSTNVVLVGWSGNIGTTFAAALGNLQNWAAFSQTLTQPAFFGLSSVGTLTSGTADPGVVVFGASAGQINNGSAAPEQLLQLGAPVPEPGTMALAALGGASLLLFRRKK